MIVNKKYVFINVNSSLLEVNTQFDSRFQRFCPNYNFKQFIILLWYKIWIEIFSLNFIQNVSMKKLKIWHNYQTQLTIKGSSWIIISQILLELQIITITLFGILFQFFFEKFFECVCVPFLNSISITK